MEKYITLILRYENLIGSIIGAFLAAGFGIITQRYLNKRKDEEEANKVIELIKNEMYLNYQLGKQMLMTKKAVYEFETDYYDKFLDKIILIEDDEIKNKILDIYMKFKTYNSGINSKYGNIMEEIRELNKQAEWGLQIESDNELNRLIIMYYEKKKKGEIVEMELENYQSKSRRGHYGIMCSIDKLSRNNLK